MKIRLGRLKDFLKSRSLDALVIMKPENRRYFSGFTGSAGALVISASEADLVTDFRYTAQAREQAACFSVVEQGSSFMQTVAQSLRGAERVAFEGDFVTYNDFSLLTQYAPEAKLVPTDIDGLREIKDDSEIECLKKAAEISDKAFDEILQVLKPGVSELFVAAELEHIMRKLGSEKPAFETIVASGERGSLPHGIASDKLIEAGDFVTMDFGAVYEGYHSDITRTVCVGKASDKQREIYDIVLNAQLLGLETLEVGKSGKEVDHVVRCRIIEAGYGKYFGHGLGHGVGLAIHELPRLSPLSHCAQLKAQMVVTVEPGVYLPGFGGVRIEDTVVLTAHGAERLTKSSKQLIEI